MRYTIPNILTLLRIFLVPVFVVVFYLPYAWSSLVATIIFFIAGVTDWLDGYIARKTGQTTAFGAFLDPVADKIMVAVALVLLVSNNPTPYHALFMAIPAAIIIGREIVISALREWMAQIGDRTQVAVSIIGKIKTSAQMLAIGHLLYKSPVGLYPTVDIGLVLFYLAAALTLWSMVIYLRAAWPVISTNDEE